VGVSRNEVAHKRAFEPEIFGNCWRLQGVHRVLERLRRRLTPRRRDVPVVAFDAAAGQWRHAAASSTDDRDDVTVTTFNIWNDPYFAAERCLAIVELVSKHGPDIMVFQEVTPDALEILLAHPWVREHCFCAAVTDHGVGNYGMLLLSRVPLGDVSYNRLPSRMSRGFLQAEVNNGGVRTVVCSVHLDSGKVSARLRGRQLRRVFSALRSVDDAIVVGDFNMRDTENDQIVAPFVDVWPALHPDEPGFTEDTSINLMRLDSRNKHRHVRFDRVLLKGPAWTAASIDLMGTEPLSDALPRVFPSDHFGVRCRLVRRR
jgi:endonuclease/exonuclease/phosphatase family metal-dependent hydrolase